MVHAGHAPLLKYLLPVHDAHLASLCVGQSIPSAPVPPEHVHVVKVHASPALGKYPTLHDTHLGVLCVGQELPVARVPPEHVQAFVEQTRFRVVVGDVDSY